MAKSESSSGTSSNAKVAEAKRAAQARVDAQHRKAVVGWVVVGIVVLGLFAALIAFIVRQQSVGEVSGAGQLTPAIASEDGGFGVGSSGVVGEDLGAGAVKLDVYFDFICPYCGLFETSQAPLLAELRAEGLVDVYFHPVAYLDDQSSGTNSSTRAASAAALIAQESPESLVAFIQLMMEDQPAEGSTGLTDEQIQSIATAAGVDDDVVARIPQHEYAAWVRAQSEAASKAGVLYTPTLGFDGDIQDPSLPASVQWAQEGALEQAIRDLAAAK